MMKSYYLCLIFLFLLIFLSVNQLSGQNLITDTLTISFQQIKNIEPNFQINEVIDQRDEDHDIIGKYEKKKFFFIPVDLLICLRKPLCHEICNFIQSPKNNDSSLVLNLSIDEYKLTKKTNSLIYPRYLLYSSISLYKIDDKNSPQYLGQLLYESTYRIPFFGDKLKKGFSKVVEKWQFHFLNDISQIAEDIKTNKKSNLENFRHKRYNGNSVNMINEVNFYLSSKCWMTDGEIYFSHREVGKQFFRSGYNMRYRKHENFDSIEFGLSTDYWFNRLNANLIFKAKSQLMIGFNRWADLETNKHKLWDILIADYSLSQSLIYNPLDKRSIILGFGIMENLYYVHSVGTKFQFGLLINLGLKL